MVKISTLLLTLATFAIAAPAPAPAPEAAPEAAQAPQSLEVLYSLAARDLELDPKNDILLSKRFIETFHSTALQERSWDDVVNLINLFNSFAQNGIDFFTNSYNAITSWNAGNLNNAINSFLLNTQIFINALVRWMQNFSGLGGVTKVLAGIYIESGLRTFVTRLGLSLMQFSNVLLGSDWSFGQFFNSITKLISTVGEIITNLTTNFPTLENLSNTLTYVKGQLQKLLSTGSFNRLN